MTATELLINWRCMTELRGMHYLYLVASTLPGIT